MPDRNGLSTEQEISIAVLRILGASPKPELPLDTIMAAIPGQIALTEADRGPSRKRAGAEAWEDQFHAILANKDKAGNFIERGFFFHRPLRLAITESGRFYLTDRLGG